MHFVCDNLVSVIKICKLCHIDNVMCLCFVELDTIQLKFAIFVLFFLPQNNKWLPLTAVWDTNDSEGSVHAQHVLH